MWQRPVCLSKYARIVLPLQLPFSIGSLQISVISHDTVSFSLTVFAYVTPSKPAGSSGRERERGSLFSRTQRLVLREIAVRDFGHACGLLQFALLVVVAAVIVFGRACPGLAVLQQSGPQLDAGSAAGATRRPCAPVCIAIGGTLLR